MQRLDLSKDKTGIFTGAYASNPVNKKLIPIWVSDYVLIGYGTGAVMGVPAHDQRDFDFASKFSLEIIQVISDSPDREKELNAAFTEDGTLINSAQFNGQDTKTAISKIKKPHPGNNICSSP